MTTQEIIDRLNEIEQDGDGEPGHNSAEIWDYVLRLEEFDESLTDTIDPDYTSTKIGLFGGAVISWDEQTKQWHETTGK